MPMVSKNVFPELARAVRGAESESRSMIMKIIFKLLLPVLKVCLAFKSVESFRV